MTTDPRIVIATPTVGSPSTASIATGYHMALLGLVRDTHFKILAAVHSCDIVRARSRLVRQFLAETDGTHLLWWDADTCLTSAQAGRLLGRLVSLDEPFVGCTYPKKSIRWGRGSGEDKAYDYPISLVENSTVDDRAVAPVEGLPLGFALCTRSMLQKMVDRYRPELEFTDVATNPSGRSIQAQTVALFQLTIHEGLLLGEDYAFSHRWRQMGGKFLLYVGEDCELGHLGAHMFQGHRAGYCR